MISLASDYLDKKIERITWSDNVLTFHALILK